VKKNDWNDWDDMAKFDFVISFKQKR